jgi:hypothetical protein
MILKEEGRKILEDDGLLDILSKYGKVQIVGSYDLDLLIKPDIDISICVDKFDIDRYFSLCSEITKKLKPSRVKYIDQSLQKLPFPFEEGYFLGLHIPRKDIVWTIDGWVFTPEIFNERVAYHNRIKQKLNKDTREILLTIKKTICNNPNYMSNDLYNAVLFENVASLPEFLAWYKGKYNKDFT